MRLVKNSPFRIQRSKKCTLQLQDWKDSWQSHTNPEKADSSGSSHSPFQLPKAVLTSFSTKQEKEQNINSVQTYTAHKQAASFTMRHSCICTRTKTTTPLCSFDFKKVKETKDIFWLSNRILSKKKKSRTELMCKQSKEASLTPFEMLLINREIFILLHFE